MKEEYLHLLWKLKRIPINQLQLVDCRTLEIIDFGLYNTASGPDFFNGKVKINGIIWSGNIELHVKASDWNVHNHQFDNAYSNVILHVVYNYDMEIKINDEVIPTLELKNLVDKEHFAKYQQLQLSKKWIPCENQISSLSPLIILQQLENSFLNRLERKSNFLEKDLVQNKNNLLQSMYQAYAKVFGLKVNELPFLELTSKLPYKLIQNKNEEEISILMLGVGGFFQMKNHSLIDMQREWEYHKQKYELDEMNFHTWKSKGLRPTSFPKKKILEFARFCAKSDFINEDNSWFELNLSHSFVNLLKINVLAIYFWWKAKRSNSAYFEEEAFNMFENLLSEHNAIILKWKNLGIRAKNAFESQALLELKNEFCIHKKCLSCKIGIALLNG